MGAAFLAYFVAEYADEVKASGLRSGPAADRLVDVVASFTTSGAAILDPQVSAPRAHTLTTAVFDACQASKVKKVDSPWDLAAGVMASIQRALAFVADLQEHGTGPRVPLRRADPSVLDNAVHEASSDVHPNDIQATPADESPLQYLLGGALGFSGQDQIRLDITLATAMQFRDFILDEYSLVLDDEAAVRVLVAGFLAAAGYAAGRWDLPLLEPGAPSGRQIAGAAKRAGFDVDSLIAVYAIDGRHMFLTHLASALRDSLQGVGVNIPEVMLISLPQHFASTGQILEAMISDHFPEAD